MVKESRRSSAYRKYMKNQITRAVTDEKMLIIAKELVKAKDERGMNLFQDEQEEFMVREYIRKADLVREC